jgi:hypothetical protein
LWDGPKDQGNQEKKKRKEKPTAISTWSCLTRRLAPFPTKPRITSTNTRIGHQRNKSRTFTEQTELFVFAVPVFFSYIINFTTTILLSLCLLPALSLLFLCYNILLSLPTNLSAPSCPFTPYLCPRSSSNLSPHYPAFLHTYNLLTSLLYQLYTLQHSAIPDTNTLYYNSRNTSKHTQGQQNPAAAIPLFPPSFVCPLLLVPPFPITQVSISRQTTITPRTPMVYRYYHQGILYIIDRQLT